MVNVEQTPDLIKISYINKEGNIELMGLEVPHEEQFKWGYTSGSGTKKFKSWDGKPIVKTFSKFLAIFL